MSNLKTTYPFSLKDNFTCDRVDVVDGFAKLDTPLKDVRPFVASFRNGLDAIVGVNRTATVYSGADADAGYLDLAGAGTRAVEYDLFENVQYTNELCFRFKIVPKGTGTLGIFAIKNSLGSERASLVFNKAENKLQFYAKQVSGSAFTIKSNVVSFVVNTTYEVELNLNFTTMIGAFYLNGAYVGGGSIFQLEPWGAGHKIKIGAIESYTSDQRMNDFEIFNKVQHAPNLDFSGEIPRTIELEYEKIGYIFPKATILTDKLIALTETKQGTGTIEYLINVNGTDKYFNGSNWVAGSIYSDIDTINANLASLNISTSANICVKAKLTGDGDSTPLLDQLEVEFSFFKEYADGATTLVYGQLKKMDGTPMIGAKVTFSKEKQIKSGETLFLNSPSVATTDSLGRFQISLVETETSGVRVNVKIEYGDEINEYKNVIIKNAQTISMADLL